MNNENERLAEVRKFLELNLESKREFNDITDLASELCERPVSLITLLDHEMNWIKCSSGISMQSSPREISFCQYSVQQDEVLVIPDTTQDERFNNNPMVYHSNPAVRFYAGAPLILSSGYRVGTLCLFDVAPGKLSPLHQRTLATLSRQVVVLMELELGKIRLLDYVNEIETKNKSLKAIAQMQSHDIRQPLTSIMGLVNLIADGAHKVDDNWLSMIKKATATLDEKIHSIVNETQGNKHLEMLH